jgi:hypothetical protein
MLVRWPAMTSERLTTRALVASFGIGADKPAGVEARLGKRPLAFGETLLGLRPAEDDPVLSRGSLLALARLLLSRAAQIDDLAQSRLRYFAINLTICFIERAYPTVSASMRPSKRVFPKSFRRLHITKLKRAATCSILRRWRFALAIGPSPAAFRPPRHPSRSTGVPG